MDYYLKQKIAKIYQIKIINDQETLDRMSIKSFEISKNFDINNSVIKLEQLYYSLLQITNIK